MKDNKIIIGKINGFHGVKGFVKVFSETRPREAILDYQELYIERAGEWILQRVEKGQVHGKNIIMKFEALSSRDMVEPLLGLHLAIDPEMLPPLPDGEYYWRDLLGLTVVDLQGEMIGVIQEILETGANDVFVVKRENAADELIPYSKTIVQSVDFERQKIVMDWEVE